MKIYTKKGDKGQTGLLGGTRVPKHHIRIEAYGTVDELNSQLGVVMAYNNHQTAAVSLTKVQDTLFRIGSHLAADPVKNKFALPEINATMVKLLEKEIDLMEKELPPLKNFILPGGSVVSSQAHVARCICRRAERCVSHLADIETVEPVVLTYLNRLSDYLFVLARYFNYQSGSEEITWQPA